MDSTSSQPAILVKTEGRQRSVRGLGEPNLPRMYNARERHARRLLIQSLREECVSGGEGEANLPLWFFYGAEAQGRVEAKRRTLEGRRFWEHFPNGAFPTDDATAASIPGIQARHVFEARLSRVAFFDTFIDISNEVLADCERGAGDWDAMEFLPAIFPYSARAWEPSTLAEHTSGTALRLHSRLWHNDPDPFQTVADRMVLQFATELHKFHTLAIGIEPPHRMLDEALLDNADFLLLFDPAWDGIEDDDITADADLDVSGPLGWFGAEVAQEVGSLL